MQHPHFYQTNVHATPQFLHKCSCNTPIFTRQMFMQHPHFYQTNVHATPPFLPDKCSCNNPIFNRQVFRTAPRFTRLQTTIFFYHINVQATPIFTRQMFRRHTVSPDKCSDDTPFHLTCSSDTPFHKTSAQTKPSFTRQMFRRHPISKDKSKNEVSQPAVSGWLPQKGSRSNVFSTPYLLYWIRTCYA